MLEKARYKLILWNGVILISLLAVVIAALYFAIATNIQNEVDNELTRSAASVIQTTYFVPLTSGSSSDSGVSASSPVALPSTVDPRYRDKEARPGEGEGGEEEAERGSQEGRLETRDELKVTVSNIFYFVVDSQGTVLANPRQITSSKLPDLNSLTDVLKGEAIFKELKIENGISIRLYSTPLRVNGRSIAGMLQVGEDLTIHQQQLQDVLFVIGLVSLGGSLLAVLAAVLLTHRALIPVRLAMQRQRDFVADASHELRTPLTVIQANAEIALRNKARTIGEKAVLLEDICQETEYLGRLISDLLTLAQADSHRLQLQLEPLELIQVVRATGRQLSSLAEAKKLDFQVNLPPNEPELWLVGDPVRLKQLLFILLDNAIKYTPDGGQVCLNLKLHLGSSLIIEVQDNGIGIPSDKQALIFERFYRVDKARSRSEGGFGLGLSIARWIVEAHKGTIRVSSQIKKGSTFTVTLPTNLPQELNQKSFKSSLNEVR